jgi:hypothetical protein
VCQELAAEVAQVAQVRHMTEKTPTKGSKQVMVVMVLNGVFLAHQPIMVVVAEEEQLPLLPAQAV